MEHLSPLDASFLEVEDEDPHVSMAIASVAIVDGPPPGQEEIVAAVRGRLSLVPRYLQRVRRLPFDLGRPVWIDVQHIDLDFHIRRTALPAPGDDAALCRLVGRIMSQRLERDRPMWECWVIEGLPNGRWALLSKVHHCMVDGVSGNELYRVLFDTTAKSVGEHLAPWRPRPTPSALAIYGDAAVQLARVPIDQAKLVWHALRTPAELVRRVGDTARGLRTLAWSLLPTAESSLSGPIGLSRRYAVARAPMADVTAVATAFGVTVNDVFLSTVAGAFRRLIQSRGDVPARDSVRSLVPVNVRAKDAPLTLDNRLSMLLPLLPVEYSDPVARLKAVHSRVAALKESKEIEAGVAVTDLAEHGPFGPIAYAVRIALRLPQRSVVTVTTNVPGAREQLYILGRRIREILPYVPIGARMRTGIAVLTYHGHAVFGVTADFDAVPEVDVFTDAIAAELHALLGAAKAGSAVDAEPASPAAYSIQAPVMPATPRRRRAR